MMATADVEERRRGMAMDTDRLERVRQRAYELWEQEGRPDGKEEEHWRRADAEIACEEAPSAPTTSEELGRAPTVAEQPLSVTGEVPTDSPTPVTPPRRGRSPRAEAADRAVTLGTAALRPGDRPATTDQAAAGQKPSRDR
jgi:DUF2934 family protein